VTQPRVKICGLRQADDAVFAARAGADAIGLVFYPPSPRAVDITTASDIARALPPFVSCVGLFVGATAAEIDQILSKVPLSVLQFHGEESAQFCGQFQLPWIKAVRMRPNINLHEQRQCYSQAQGLLLDAYKAGVPGGTGDQFDWQRIPADIAKDVVLAGVFMSITYNWLYNKLILGRLILVAALKATKVLKIVLKLLPLWAKQNPICLMYPHHHQTMLKIKGTPSD